MLWMALLRCPIGCVRPPVRSFTWIFGDTLGYRVGLAALFQPLDAHFRHRERHPRIFARHEATEPLTGDAVKRALLATEKALDTATSIKNGLSGGSYLVAMADAKAGFDELARLLKGL